MLPAGSLREVLVIEQAEEHRNELGETVQTSWREVARRRASVEPVAYTETQDIVDRTHASNSFHVRMRFFAGLAGGMRLRWENRENRLLYISSIVERGRREEHDIYAEERA